MFSDTQQFRDWDDLQKAIDAAPTIPGCTNYPDAFYPDQSALNEISWAKKTCARCPVMEKCRMYGIKWEAHGFWGGMSPGQRQKARVALGISISTRKSVAEPLESSIDPLLGSDFADAGEVTEFFEGEPVSESEFEDFSDLAV